MRQGTFVTILGLALAASAIAAAASTPRSTPAFGPAGQATPPVATPPAPIPSGSMGPMASPSPMSKMKPS
jgi:hypothetical protein